MLNLKPIMDIDHEGKLRQRNKVRGKVKVYQQFVETIRRHYMQESSAIHIGHGDCEEDAEALADLIKKELGHDHIIINPESPTIGSHVGPGLLVISFFGNERA
jgi:fatty acid-binding protein DegV